ncbi:MAG: 50S ribosomal protein L6 [Candidatus Aenigmatarchaeota archaeon]
MPEYEVSVIAGVQATLEGGVLKVKGPKGELSREFSHHAIKVVKDGEKITISSGDERKKVKAMMGTWRAHMKNMMTGVTKGWKCTLKLVYAHFPVKLEHKGNKLMIRNFIGSRADRSAEILSGVGIKITGDVIELSGTDREKVGQTAANIETATKVRGFDRRVFQDGIYVTEKTDEAK